MTQFGTEFPGNGWAGHNRSTIDEVAVGDLVIDPDDPWKHKQEDVERAVPFVKSYAANHVLPVMIDEHNNVISGSAFVEAGIRARIKRFRVVRQVFPDVTQRKLFSVASNKILSTGFWDGEALAKIVLEFEKSIEDFSHDLIAFPPGLLDKLIGGSISSAGADDLPITKTLNPVSAIGRVWLAGPHRIMCGNATDSRTLAILMMGQLAAAVCSDPPFGCPVDGFVSSKGKHREFVQASGEMTEAELLEFFRQLCLALSAVIRPGALVYLFIDWRSLHLLLAAGREVFGKLVNLCVWSKDRGGMGSFYRSQHELVLIFQQPGAKHANNIQLGKHGVNRTNVWSYPSAASSRKGREGDLLKSHPTPKIVEMIGDAMLDCTVRGEIIVDTFLGSGTSLIAAERTGRICFGMDLDPLYVDLAIRRWQAWTGENAVDAETGETFDFLAQRVNEGERGR
ncbi:DNA modification methylase [Sphingomonas sp. RB1R13]|uniref:DNA modification methylase n=1 Tax=Sphingomonas sp. RB1R13 TaxID=3096159 RepID=UPI002FCA357E